MSDYSLFTSESVSEGHPDKMSDQISDAILDTYLTKDPDARVAVETLVKTGMVVVAGEVTTAGNVTPGELEEVIRQTSTITEEEMLQLRVLRTIFYASVTLGEHSPLISYLVKNDIPVFDFFKCLVKF